MNNITNPKLLVCYHSIKHLITGGWSNDDECITINDWGYTGDWGKLVKLVEGLGCAIQDLSDDDEWVLEVYAK